MKSDQIICECPDALIGVLLSSELTITFKGSDFGTHKDKLWLQIEICSDNQTSDYFRSHCETLDFIPKSTDGFVSNWNGDSAILIPNETVNYPQKFYLVTVWKPPA